jgi:outer membrane protein assembly factor BamB
LRRSTLGGEAAGSGDPGSAHWIAPCIEPSMLRPLLLLAALASVALAAGCSSETESGEETEDELRQPTVSSNRFELPPGGGISPPSGVGRPYGDKVKGLLTFRGNPTRSFYGHGPVPRAPKKQWAFPKDGQLCAKSTVGNETKTWCGTGWTGQPSMFERDGKTWVVFGAYDKNIHFLDATTGERLRDDFPTNDIIKGSVTIDPDGYPIVYSGSRDDKYRAIAFDTNPPRELYALKHRDVPEPQWNSDWDGAGIVLNNHLFVGGENSWFHVVKLDRSTEGGRVALRGSLVAAQPAYDNRLLTTELESRKGEASIENSVVVIGNTVFFSNSGGLVQGWDVGGIETGKAPERVFRFWTGDDTDASLVADEEGMLYVGQEYERQNQRSRDCGQIIKINPRKASGAPEATSCDPNDPNSPVVWSYKDLPHANPSGVWGSPALYKDLLVVPTHRGDLIGFDRKTGQVRWKKRLGDHLWSSPVIVDGHLIQGTCSTGELVSFDLSDTTREPVEEWRFKIDGACIESTPAVYNGRIVVGTRGGKVYSVGD